MEALFGSSPKGQLVVWQDREIRFDVGAAELACRTGEVVVDRLVSGLCCQNCAHACMNMSCITKCPPVEQLQLGEHAHGMECCVCSMSC